MKLAIAVGITLGVLGTGVALAEVITNDTAIQAPSSESTIDFASLQITSPTSPAGIAAPGQLSLPTGGQLNLGAIGASAPKSTAGSAGGNTVTPNTVPTPGALSLMAMSALTIMGRTRRAPAHR